MILLSAWWSTVNAVRTEVVLLNLETEIVVTYCTKISDLRTKDTDEKAKPRRALAFLSHMGTLLPIIIAIYALGHWRHRQAGL